jgi:hypothetical protein
VRPQKHHLLRPPSPTAAAAASVCTLSVGLGWLAVAANVRKSWRPRKGCQVNIKHDFGLLYLWTPVEEEKKLSQTL